MAQITIRASDDLVQRVKRSASDLGRSMNDYVTSVLDAATDPDLAGYLGRAAPWAIALRRFARHAQSNDGSPTLGLRCRCRRNSGCSRAARERIRLQRSVSVFAD